MLNFTTSKSVEVIECRYTTELGLNSHRADSAMDSGRVCSGRERALP
jgi:hypothetical protein